MKKVIGLFIIFSPFTSYFALSSWLRFPVVIILFLVVLFFVTTLVTKSIPSNFFKVTSSEIILFVLLGLICISFLINHEKRLAINHVLAYAFAFIVYFMLFRRIVESKDLRYEFVLKMFAYSALICGLIIVADWVLINTIGIGFRRSFVNLDNRTANMDYYANPYFMTVGGVAEEPGSMGLFVNIIFPLGLLYCSLSKRFRFLFVLLVMYVLSLFFLFSTAAILNVIIALIFVAVITALRHQGNFRVHKYFAGLMVLFVFISIGASIFLVVKRYDILVSQFDTIKSKIFLKEESVSASERSETWQIAIDQWKESPFFGNGPGRGTRLLTTGYHSVYLTLLSDTGILSLIVFIVFISYQLWKVLQIRPALGNYLVIPLIATLLHFVVVGDFYHAPFWILLVVIHMVFRSEKLKSAAT